MIEEALDNLDADADVAVGNPQLFLSVAELQPKMRILLLEANPMLPLPSLEAMHAVRKNVLNPAPMPKLELCEVLRVLTQHPGHGHGRAMVVGTATAMDTAM